MKFKLACLVLLIALCAAILAGCCTPGGCFARTEERLINLGESTKNIALDGDGVN